MSVAPLDPAGINAAGNGSIWFVPALADPAAPTVAEINAGVNLSCALYGFNPTLTYAAAGGGSRRKYCAESTSQEFGEEQRGIDQIEYDYNPQELDADGYTYYSVLAPETTGFVIDRRGLKAKTEAVEAAQLVDVHPVRLKGRVRTAIDPNSTDLNAKLTTQQFVEVIGPVLLDVAVVA